MASLLYAVAAVVSLIITPGLLFYFDVTPKVGVLLIGTAALLVLLGTAPIRSWPRPVRLFAILLAIEALAATVATVLSTRPELSLLGTNWRRFGLIPELGVLAFSLITCLALAGRPDRLRNLLRWITAAGLIAAAYGSGQYFGFDPLLSPNAYTIGEGEWSIIRPPGTLGHSSYAATYYLSIVFAGFVLWRADASRFWRLLGLSACAAGSIAIVLSGARAAMLGLVVGALVLIAVIRPRLNARRAAAIAGATVLCVGFYLSPAGSKLRSRVRWSLEDARGGARILLWRDSLAMSAARPFAGWGPETFGSEFPRFQSKDLARAYPDFYYESPHNILIDALVSTGVLGVAALAALCAAGCYSAWQARRASPVEATALGSGLVAIFVAQQFTAFTVTTAMYLHLTIAVLVAMRAGTGMPVSDRRSWLGVAVAIVLAVAGARLLVADRLLARVQHALERGDLKAASATYRTSREWQWPGSYSDLWYSRALAQRAQTLTDLLPRMQVLQEGYTAAQWAVDTAEDRHNAFYNLAAYCAIAGESRCVESNLRYAIRWAPHWFKPHWTLARALQLAGRSEEAAKEGAIAIELSGGKHTEVTATLKDGSITDEPVK
jgi:O-antigen ligase